MLESDDAVFQTTPWTLVRQLQEASSDEAAKLLGALAERYWPCIYAFLRRSGHPSDRAAELTQGFFAEIIVQRGLLAQADKRQGRLRSYMLTALKRYCVDVRRRGSVIGRDMPIVNASVRTDDALIDARSARSPEEAFDLQWATTALQETLRRCERHYRKGGRPAHWEAYFRAVVLPCQTGAIAPSQVYLARELGFENAGAVASAIFLVKKRLRVLLREVVAESVDETDESEEEFRYVVSLLGG